METVVAQRGDRRVYLLQIDQERGRILDAENGLLYPPKQILSILVRGYWNQPATDTPPLDELLANVTEVPDSGARGGD